MDVYTHFKHTFMFKQLVNFILHPMIPLIDGKDDQNLKMSMDN